MTAAIAFLGALGIALIASGIPALHRDALAERVEPYLNGLGGRATSVRGSVPQRTGITLWLETALAPILPRGGPVLLQRLDASGTGAGVAEFRLEQLLWAAAALCLSTAIMLVFGGGVGGALLLVSLLGAATGAVARDRRLSREIARRRERVRQEMPVAIDLLTLAIMAGEAVPSAFERVATLLDGDVARGFRHVVGSIRAGVPTPSALAELGVRIPHGSAARLADCLCVAIERGAPLAEVLRSMADDLRDARRRDLLEMGGRREIAMLVPVVFLILPTTIAFVLLPGLVSLDLVVP